MGFEYGENLAAIHGESYGRSPNSQPVEIMSQVDLRSEVTNLEQLAVKPLHQELKEAQNPVESSPDWITQLVMQGIPDTSSQADPQKD
uniref:Male-enhanced antigen 1 n=1 Tax=Ditylenchus dipsaci TaxID=166011 RepID=A0A915ET17_9BILA